MAVKELNARVGMRTDTSSNWASVNPVLGKNEVVLESDTRLLKQGDGVSTYNNQLYLNSCNISRSVNAGTLTISIPAYAQINKIGVKCTAASQAGSITIRNIIAGESDDLIAYIQNVEKDSEYIIEANIVQQKAHTISIVASTGVAANIRIY